MNRRQKTIWRLRPSETPRRQGLKCDPRTGKRFTFTVGTGAIVRYGWNPREAWRRRKRDESRDGGQMMEMPNPPDISWSVCECAQAIILVLLWAHYRGKSEKIGGDDDDDADDDDANDDDMLIISKSVCRKLPSLLYPRDQKLCNSLQCGSVVPELLPLRLSDPQSYFRSYFTMAGDLNLHIAASALHWMVGLGMKPERGRPDWEVQRWTESKQANKPKPPRRQTESGQ